MFVPKGPIPSAASLRNARRRQRTDSDESVKLPTAKRQRSALRQETSESPLYAGDGETRHEPPEVSVPVQKDEFSPISSDGSGTQKRIAIRGARKPEQPEDGVNKTIILVSYAARALPTPPFPSFPRRLLLYRELIPIIIVQNRLLCRFTTSCFARPISWITIRQVSLTSL